MTFTMGLPNLAKKASSLFLACVLCSSCVTLNKEPVMKFEELLKSLDAASPWPPEKTAQILGADFTVTHPTDVVTSYRAARLVYEDAVIETVELRLKTASNAPVRLILALAEESGNCPTFSRIKELYPNLENTPYPDRIGPGWLGREQYLKWAARPWGHIGFAFRTTPSLKPSPSDCLADVIFIPTGTE